MKLAPMAAIVFAFGSAFAQGQATDPCAVWTLDGYRPNMARDEALAVRPATKQTYLTFEVKDPGKSSGYLSFDNTGKLKSYGGVLVNPASAADLVTALRARLGEPDFVDSPVKMFNGTGRATGWRSSSCDATVQVVEPDKSEADGSDRASVTFGIARASTNR